MSPFQGHVSDLHRDFGSDLTCRAGIAELTLASQEIPVASGK